MGQLLSSRVEMLELIKREAISRGFSFYKRGDSDFIIKSADSEVRGSVRESGRGKVKHPKKMWVGIWGPTFNFLKELNDDSRCFIVEMDYLKGNFLTIPFSQIPKDCWYPYGWGRGQSIHISRNEDGYSIGTNERSIPLGDYVNNLEVLFKRLIEGERYTTQVMSSQIEQKTSSLPPITPVGLESVNRLAKSAMEIEETEEAAEETELEVEENARRVYADKLDLDVATLCNRIQNGDLILQPEFQREYVWDDTKASRFIESILMQIPTPLIYLAEDVDGKKLTIDGHQRLKSIFRFWSNEFPLKNLTFFKELNGKKFKDFEKEYQRSLLDGVLRTILIKRESDSDVKFELFERLNTGSVHLNAQELRNCIYLGPYNDFIKDIANDRDLLFLLGLKMPDKRMQDRELALRFLAFYHTPYYQYKPPMKKFLNNEMKRHRNISKDEADKLKTVFKKSVYLTKIVFGDKAFKRFVEGNETDPNGFWEGRVNRALYDIVMFGFTLYEKRQIVSNSDAIREELIWLMTHDEDFIRSIRVSTDKKDHVYIHFKKWLNSLETIVGTPKVESRAFTLNYKKQLYDNNSICRICGNNIQLLDDAEVDHVDMYWRGGKTIPSNARLVHRYCNRTRTKSG